MKSAIIEAAEYIERQCRDLDERSMMNHARTASLRKLAKRLRAESAIPAGWKLVPVEPTAEMLIRGGEEFFDSARNWEIDNTLNDQDHAAMIYEGMLSAAPEPPAVKDSSAVEKSSVIRAPQRGGG